MVIRPLHKLLESKQLPMAGQFSNHSSSVAHSWLQVAGQTRRAYGNDPRVADPTRCFCQSLDEFVHCKEADTVATILRPQSN